MAKISDRFPDYARLADGLRTGAIPSTPDNLAAHARAFADYRAHQVTRVNARTLTANRWANTPVAAACWASDAAEIEH